ncbi:GNAT family N-acetyltransferase [Cutibacterium sp. WCA-380-WT-3A]|uniref:GNAT family N-acetyltransferase n=1 Tax=Cutibacterium porci TaxID=2605781 RepID=A0A7K0J9U9_9ACTN|nr:GNAT family N-acetyltransferase [Cutibacterium porci]MSS46742.1 GNAT family N-acetyltransferase [Cutibacterium porci]
MATTRRATPADLPLMIHALRHAAGGVNGPLDVEECRTSPAIAHYINGWTPDQVGLICLAANTPIGAAWIRDLPETDPGYGFVAPGIPELTIAISPHHRGKGHGSYLLASLLDSCRRSGIRSVSVGVDAGNPAAELFQEAGFVSVCRRDGRVVMLRVSDASTGV